MRLSYATNLKPMKCCVATALKERKKEKKNKKKKVKLSAWYSQLETDLAC